EAGRADDADGWILGGLEANPRSADLQAAAAAVLARRGLFAEAAALLEEVAKQAPRSAEVQLDLGRVYEQAKRPDAAKAAYRRAADLARDQRWKALTNLGDLLCAEGGAQAAEGEKLLEEAARLAPAGELAPGYNLALARWNRGDRAGARKAAEQVARAERGDEGLRREARRFLDAIAREGA
ncbi:MAG TPA: tetratricopeptide repeat protein, partial [Planctomycetota bacterium]|nr:tetratricopeptide repeat protein [Planctomycetota bacterium]